MFGGYRLSYHLSWGEGGGRWAILGKTQTIKEINTMVIYTHILTASSRMFRLPMYRRFGKRRVEATRMGAVLSITSRIRRVDS